MRWMSYQALFSSKSVVNKMKRNERGSALVYILIAIALLAALTISFMEPSSQQSQSQNTYNLTSELAAQADYIRTTIQECVVLYPGGDGGALPPNPLVQHNNPFPLNPTDAYLTPLPTPPTDPLVRDLRCPGNPGNDPDHQPIFSGQSGKFLSPIPSMFDDWQYYNGPDGVFFWTQTDKTDAYINTALTKLNEQFGACEADVVQTGGSAVSLDNANTALCPADSYCLRIWMITDNEITTDPELSVFSAAESATCP